MTIDRAVVGLDFFPPLKTMTVAVPQERRIEFGSFPVTDPRSGAKIRAIQDDVRAALLPVTGDYTVVIGQCYAGIGDDEIYDALVEACESPTILVRHHKVVTHFTGVHSMSRNEFVMERMPKSKGERFGEVYAEALMIYGQQQRLRSAS